MGINHKHAILSQLNKEAKWSLYVTLLYVLAWLGFGYLPEGVGVLGFPLWFELSCLLLPVGFVVGSIYILKTVYKPIDLDSTLLEQDVHDNQ